VRFCRPCIPAPAHKKAASTLAKTLGSTAFSIVVTIIVLVVVSVALLVYMLNRDLRMPVVSQGLSACQMPRVSPCVQHSVDMFLHCIHPESCRMSSYDDKLRVRCIVVLCLNLELVTVAGFEHHTLQGPGPEQIFQDYWPKQAQPSPTN